MQGLERTRSWLGSRLGARILTAMVAVMLLASLASLALFVPLYRHELTVERQAVSAKLGAFLQITLENAMLKRDIDGLRDIVERLGRIENVAAIAILNPALEVRFSSNSAQLGVQHQSLEALCPDCGLTRSQGGTGATFIENTDGRQILRSVNAVANREPCMLCHGSVAENPVNGFLIVDYQAEGIKDRAWQSAALLSAVGFLIVVLAVAAAWRMLQRFVLKPVALLTQASHRLAAGDLTARSALAGTHAAQDEIGELAHTFDHMAMRLAQTVSDLKERDHFQQGLLDAIPDGIRVIADDYSVIAANTEFARQSGLTLEEVRRQPCYWSSHRRDEPCIPTLVICPVQSVVREGEAVKCMHIHTRPEGGPEPEYAVEVVAAPLILHSSGGARRFVVEAIRDLSQNLNISQDQRMSEIGQLATGVAHEIHNPLASIRLGLSAVRKTMGTGPQVEEAGHYLNLVDAEIERCIDVTGRLMKLSQTSGERGTLVDFARIAGDAASLLSYEALTRRIALVVDVPDNTRVVVSEGEMGMVLINLLQNAFHATREGGTVTVSGGTDAEGHVVIEIADTGVGIAPDNLARIFHPFWSWRADGSTGSGLGLAICKALVTKWHGTITVRSQLEVGTTFTLTFPHADMMIDPA